MLVVFGLAIFVILYNQIKMRSENRIIYDPILFKFEKVDQKDFTGIKKPIQDDLCHYPFGNFLTDYDRLLYIDCLTKTEKLNEIDAVSLNEATLFYELNYGNPPRHFEKWYAFAIEKKCRINRYDQLYEQLAPFQNNKEDYEKILQDLKNLFNSTQLTKIEFKEGKLNIDVNNPRAKTYIAILERMQQFMPDMKFVINTHAQPVIMGGDLHKGIKSKTNHNAGEIGTVQVRLFEKEDQLVSTSSVMSMDSLMEKTCIPDPYRESIKQGYGLFLSAPEEYQTFEKAPVLSWGSYPGCSMDILIPSVFHYDYLKITEKPITYSKFSTKHNKLFFRGATSGSPFYENIGEFLPDHICVDACKPHQYQIINPVLLAKRVWLYGHRQRMVSSASFYPKMMDIQFVNGVEMHPDYITEAFKNYFYKTRRIRFEKFFENKFIMDVDGNGYSGRFLKLLQGNSLVFSAHYAKDWFSDIAIPFYHYIPVHMGYTNINYTVLPELYKTALRKNRVEKSKFQFNKLDGEDDFNTPMGFNDMAPKLLYFQNNLEISEQIATRGQSFGKSRLREDDMDCFLFRTFIELYEILQNKS